MVFCSQRYQSYREYVKISSRSKIVLETFFRAELYGEDAALPVRAGAAAARSGRLQRRGGRNSIPKSFNLLPERKGVSAPAGCARPSSGC